MLQDLVHFIAPCHCTCGAIKQHLHPPTKRQKFMVNVDNDNLSWQTLTLK